MRALVRYPLLGSLLCLPLAVGCGDSDDPPSGSTPDTGESDGLDSPDVEPVACDPMLVPADGDTCDCEGGSTSNRDGLCDRTCVCTNGFFVCEDDCGTAEPVTLRWVTPPALVEVDGNGDRDVNPGEVWALEGTVVLANAETPVSTTVRATTASGRISLPDDPLSFPELDAAPEDFVIEFDVNANATAGPVVITVEAFTDGFQLIEHRVTFEVVELDRPVLSFVSDRLVEVVGDGNPVVDAGETWKVIATLRNGGSAAAEGVVLTAAPSSSSLTVVGDPVNVGVLSAGASREIEVTFEVSATPADLTPAIDLAATASNAGTATRVVPVSVRPPDTLRFDEDITFSQVEGEGNNDEFTDEGEVWELVFPVRNAGTFTIPGLEFTLRNYATPIDPVTGEPITDPESGLPIDDPAVTDLGFVLEDAPASLAASEESELRAVVEIPAGDATQGRILITPRSSIRQHAPFAYDIVLPRP
jgi:hypothetical protein